MNDIAFPTELSYTPFSKNSSDRTTMKLDFANLSIRPRLMNQERPRLIQERLLTIEESRSVVSWNLFCCSAQPQMLDEEDPDFDNQTTFKGLVINLMSYFGLNPEGENS
jgi:hypothetical protein